MTISKAFGLCTLENVRKYMSDGVPRTAREIAEGMGVRDTSASGVMRHLESNGLAHIVAWPDNKQGKPAAQWLLAPGKSMPRPPTKAAIGGHAWRKLHREPERPAQPWHETFRPFRDPMVAAFFGEYGSAP